MSRGLSAPAESVSLPNGHVVVACPDRAGYELALSALRTSDERTIGSDATDEIQSLGVEPATTQEALFESIWPLLKQRFTDGEQQPQIGLTWHPEESWITIEVLGLADDSVIGFAYTIIGRPTDDGWVVDRATKASICARGVTGDDQLCV